jgi:hypothetical protein
MKKEVYNRLITVVIFAIAMAFLEAVFVVYLRRLFYPDGFSLISTFPMDGFVYRLELLRESATIIMLACLGILAGKTKYEKVAYFLCSFAIWDIFYYVFLKIIIGWPASLLTWDALFLIPLQWIGPVLAPVLVSLTMLLLGILIIKFNSKKKVFVEAKENVLFALGSFAILYTFLYDYSSLIITGGFFSNLFGLLSDPRFIQAVTNYSPFRYNWLLFICGEILILIGIALFYRRYRK